MGEHPKGLAGLPLLDDLGELRGRRVLVRVDFNVPLERTGDGWRVADDYRIRASLPTLEWLVARGADVVCCTHLGRPSGPDDGGCQLAPVRAALEALCPGVDMLENLRFDPGEPGNHPGFVDRLVEGFDAYVNDAFSVAHRAHASVVGPPTRLPSAAGLRLAQEVEVLTDLVASPVRPFVAVLGGAKVADKLGAVAAVARVADVVLVGGGMAFTFLAAQGRRVGGSLLDATRLEECRAVLAASGHVELPSDVVALSPGAAYGPGETGGEVATFDGDLPDGWIGLDVGEATAAAFAKELAGAATILWNGPMGAFEDARFARGTDAVARATAASRAFSVVGGGDSERAVAASGLAEDVSFISTGGGAMLALLEHGDLPGLAALRAAPNARGRR
ncbi:MAG TPA: phosphoglycerate kinase [Acidimicrobiales bacterium]|nr:phosphoglycerate kinase [Acidimicrobiales bacterium]